MKRWLKAIAFFLLFLLIVGGLSIPRYVATLKRSKEVVLQQHLWTMRRAIDFYAKDKGKGPQSLNDLVSAGYLREIPVDPFTKSNQAWTIEREKEPSVSNTPPGIFDVHSSATGADANGKPYNQY